MEPTLMQKVKDAIASFDYEAHMSPGGITLHTMVGGAVFTLGIAPNESKRLRFTVNIDGAVRGDL